jgi:hypothetical protein
MEAAVIGLALCVALLAVLVASATRRMARVERAVEQISSTSRPVGPPPPREPLLGSAAPPVSGVDLSGRKTGAELSGRKLLAFLTGSCGPCRVFWSGLADDRDPGLPVVVVTPAPATESPRGLARVAGPSTSVVMSSDAWLAYRVRGAPWFVLVEEGLVLAEGRAESWEELEALAADRSLFGEGSRSSPGEHRPGGQTTRAQRPLDGRVGTVVPADDEPGTETGRPGR